MQRNIVEVYIYIYTILEEWIVAIRSNKIDRDKPSREAELFHDLSLFSLLVFLNALNER